MGRKAARRAAPRADSRTDADAAPLSAPGGRQPCPCGSGRRYKACHGREAAREADSLTHRPFAGLASECDWVALREIVPAATAPLALAPRSAGPSPAADQPGRPAVTLATVLPMAWPALRRRDGTILVGLQVPGGSGDASRDVAAALVRALAAEPGSTVPPLGPPGPGPRLQDVLDPAVPLVVTVRDDFDFWLDGAEPAGSEVTASMERANAAVVPTERLRSVEAAYWCRMRERNHLRWVLPQDEEALLDAMARLHAAGGDSLGAGTRYVGSFRAHGRLVPVWDLASATPADAVEQPAADYAERLGEALATEAPLDAAQRRARYGLLSRQVTIR